MKLTDKSDCENPAPTNADLYRRQMERLKAFYERKAISKEQYEYSASELTRKMKL